jgi:hypothetical protein
VRAPSRQAEARLTIPGDLDALGMQAPRGREALGHDRDHALVDRRLTCDRREPERPPGDVELPRATIQLGDRGQDPGLQVPIMF